MKTLQTILGSLALATAVSVPASGQFSKNEFLDSILQGRNILIDAPSNELVQKAEKTDAEKIFDFYKGKTFKVEDARITTSSGSFDRVVHSAVYEFPNELDGTIKPHTNYDAGFTSKGRKGLMVASGDDGDALWVEGFRNYLNRPTFFRITLNAKNEQLIECNYASGEEWNDVQGSSVVFKEFSKSEYDEADKLKKGIIGKYVMKDGYSVINNKKSRVVVDLSIDHRVSNENLIKFKKMDPETGELKEHELYVDYKRHSPVEIEFNGKGELIFSPGKYKEPFKTFYDFNLANNNFFYHTCLEMINVVPKSGIELAKEYWSTHAFSDKIIPVFKLDGSMALEMHRSSGDATHIFILEKVK